LATKYFQDIHNENDFLKTHPRQTARASASAGARAGAGTRASSLRTKASRNFEEHLRNTKDRVYNPGFSKANMTDAEWAELSRQMESEGIVFREETVDGRQVMRMYNKEQLRAQEAAEAAARAARARTATDADIKMQRFMADLQRDHGYIAESPAPYNFINLLHKYNIQEGPIPRSWSDGQNILNQLYTKINDIVTDISYAFVRDVDLGKSEAFNQLISNIRQEQELAHNYASWLKTYKYANY